MIAQDYHQLIIEGIKGLPPELLAEVADFVYFIRKRAMQPEDFQEELRNVLLNVELRQLSQSEENHLEEEFEGYEHLYPHE